MEIVVLGGAGDMAGRAVRELAAEPDLTALTIADYDLESAKRLASELGDKVSAVWVDAKACIEPEPFLTELERRGVAVQDMTGQWPQAVN